MKIAVAVLQMPSEPAAVAINLDRADAMLGELRGTGAVLAVLPEMFNTGHALLPDFGPLAEGVDGPTLRHLSARSRQWGMAIAAGFVERDGRELHDAMTLCLPDRSIHVYRKRSLVFWERFRFRPGRFPLIVPTPWGRVGLAICADMIERRVWDGYRGQIDFAVISAAWPDFASRRGGGPHWLLGPLGPMATTIPAKVAHDLAVPVIFANQCGETETIIPVLGLLVVDRITDRFAGRGSIHDAGCTSSAVAGIGAEILLSEITVPDIRGKRSCHSTCPSAAEVFSSGSAWPGLV